MEQFDLEISGVLKEESDPDPVNHELETDKGGLPSLTKAQLCSAPYSPPPEGIPQTPQFSTFDESPSTQRQPYGEAYDMQLPRYDGNARPPPPTYREATQTQLFVDPMNYGYDQTQCGNQFDATTTTVIVAQPRQTSPAFQTDKAMPDITVHAILATILCCCPLGIVAVVFACRARNMKRNGDVEGAKSSAKVANVLLALSVIFGIIGYVFIPLLSEWA